MPTPVATTRGAKLVLKVEDVADSGIYTVLCTINAERGVNFTANMSEDVVDYCDDPLAVAWMVRDKVSLSVEFSGGGRLHKQDVKRMWDWYKDEAPRSCQVILDDDDAANVITFTGDFHLTGFNPNAGDKRTRVACTLSLASDGEITGDFGANVD